MSQRLHWGRAGLVFGPIVAVSLIVTAANLIDSPNKANNKVDLISDPYADPERKTWVKLEEKPAPCVATYNKFLQIKSGYVQNYVNDLMGCEGNLTSSIGKGSYGWHTYTFDGESFGSQMIVIYKGRRVSAVSQYGLR